MSMKIEKITFRLTHLADSNYYYPEQGKILCAMLRTLLQKITDLDIGVTEWRMAYSYQNDTSYTAIDEYITKNCLMFGDVGVDITSYSINDYIIVESTDSERSLISSIKHHATTVISDGCRDVTYTYFLCHNENEFYLFSRGATAENNRYCGQSPNVHMMLGFNGTDLFVNNKIYKNCSYDDVVEMDRVRPSFINSELNLLNNLFICDNTTTIVNDFSDRFIQINKSLNVKSLYMIDNIPYLTLVSFADGTTLMFKCDKDYTIDEKTIRINDANIGDYAKYTELPTT